MSDLKGTSPPDYKATAEKLLSAANDGAKSLKALFFWYVGALAYAVISVAGVTDEQLLKASPLKLPILSVDIPLVEYFAILPLVVVLIHLELLVQFALLSNKVNDFKSGLRHLSADEASDFRLRLENFMLSHLLAGKHNAILHTLLFLLIQGALVALPLFSLLTIQAQFLAYHSEPMMWWHRILVLIDALALLYFWPNLFHREDMKAGAWLKLMAFRVVPRVVAFLILLAAVYALLAWFRWPLAEIGLVLGLVLIAAVVFSLRASPWRRGQRVIYGAGHHLARWVLIPLYLLALAAIAFWIDRVWIAGDAPVLTIGVVAATVGAVALAWRRSAANSPRMMWTKMLRWAVRNHDLGLRRDAPGMSVFGTQCVLALATSGWLLSIPMEDEITLELDHVCGEESWGCCPPQGEPEGWEWLLYPASPHGRYCLIRLDLAGDTIDDRASVPAILLSGMGMRRVLVLDEKVLANQELTPAQREKLRSGDADARRDIEPIDLRGRDLTGIQLNEAVLPRARFDQSTRLDNASFRGAQLQGSIVPDILRWSQIEDANVQGVIFERSHVLSGALLDAKDLSDTTFVEGRISGALLDRVILKGARLDETELENTILIDPVGVQSGMERPRYPAPEKCLHILGTDSPPQSPLMNCAYIIHAIAAAPAAPPTPEFWTGFWQAQMWRPCRGVDGMGADGYLRDVFDRLTKALYAHEDIQGDMAQAAIAVATSDQCQSRFTRDSVAATHQELADEIASEAESGVVPTTVRQSEAFYAAWLEELDRIEKEQLSTSTTP